MSEKINSVSQTVRPIHNRKDKAAKSRKQVPHVYCPGQAENFPISKCREYCQQYYKGLVLGGIACSYHAAVTCHLELKSDPSTGKLSLTDVAGPHVNPASSL